MVPPQGALSSYTNSSSRDECENLRQEIDSILLQTETSANTLRSLYTLSKSRHKKVSLTYLCRRSGIPSKGYLAFVMSGKRKLNMKYWGSICQTFKLEGIREHILKTQLQIEISDCPDTQELLQVQLATLRQILQEQV